MKPKKTTSVKTVAYFVNQVKATFASLRQKQLRRLKKLNSLTKSELTKNLMLEDKRNRGSFKLDNS
jgi:hypothetical protein